MFSVKFFNQNDMEIKKVPMIRAKDETESFITLIHVFVDIMNGAPQTNQMLDNLYSSPQFKKVNERFSIPLTDTHKMFLPNVSDPKTVIVSASVFFEFTFKQFGSELLELNQEPLDRLKQIINTVDTSNLYYSFMEILPTFKIPGVSRIETKCMSTQNQIKLHQIQFPMESVPNHYCCILTGVVMSTPTKDKSQPDNDNSILLDISSFETCFSENGGNGKHPYTQLPLKRENLIVDQTLKQKIDNFVSKAEYIYQLYPFLYKELYKKYIEEITGDSPLSEFKLFADQLEVKDEIKIPEHPEIFQNFKTSNPNQALRRAAATGQIEHIEKLLRRKDVAIDLRDNNPLTGYTPLHLAILKNKIPAAECLLLHKASYVIMDNKGETALNYILENKLDSLLDFIIKHRILKEYDTYNVNVALRIAAQKNHPSNVKILLKREAAVNHQSPTQKQTALHYAAIHDHMFCVVELLEGGADKTIKDAHGKTPFDYAHSQFIQNLLCDQEKKTRFKFVS